MARHTAVITGTTKKHAQTDGVGQRAAECGQRGGDGVTHAEVGGDRRGSLARREHRVGDRQRQADEECERHADTGAGDDQHRWDRRGGGQGAEQDRTGQSDEVHAPHAVEVAERTGAQHGGRHGECREAGDKGGGGSGDVQAG
jgi:hypothetical protein